MVRVVVDDEVRTKLGNLSEVLEICDSSGQLLGYFAPATERPESERLKPQVSDEELRRRAEQGGGRPLAEILERLGKLG